MVVRQQHDWPRPPHKQYSPIVIFTSESINQIAFQFNNEQALTEAPWGLYTWNLAHQAAAQARECTFEVGYGAWQGFEQQQACAPARWWCGPHLLGVLEGRDMEHEHMEFPVHTTTTFDAHVLPMALP